MAAKHAPGAHWVKALELLRSQYLERGSPHSHSAGLRIDWVLERLQKDPNASITCSNTPEKLSAMWEFALPYARRLCQQGWCWSMPPLSWSDSMSVGGAYEGRAACSMLPPMLVMREMLAAWRQTKLHKASAVMEGSQAEQDDCQEEDYEMMRAAMQAETQPCGLSLGDALDAKMLADVACIQQRMEAKHKREGIIKTLVFRFGLHLNSQNRTSQWP